MEKEKNLIHEKEQLLKENPFSAENAGEESSEDLEEAMLTDNADELSDIRVGAIDEALEQVRKALAKIEEGTYGICEKTGEPIDVARLEAYPEATTAVD
ncbi:hypothetical protein A3K42_00085 [candidate division WWE3 bacterium RBG_13_37_7]|uniref:Zinc finger DksA/TraR C4-type domain-containing protein n=1 Tax=candidate division WWE3 bacterium RBG_13_37_7 TaxID=1802609 RepID=A0A1F4U166_UNCKA|nr:MAG: hypothetical protein A3K42_00085 [candidate division WWE3 bacterium RBG_13_37_7]